MSKNLMIGLFVIAAFAVFLFMIFFIHPNVGNEAAILRVRFSNIDKVNLGTRVTFGGKTVGKVIDIFEIIQKEPRMAYQGHVYIYELQLAVNNDVKVYNSDRISLQTSGLLGEKSVNITPLPALKGEKLILMNNQILYADEEGSVEDAFALLKNVTTKIGTFLDQINEVLVDIKTTGGFKSLSHSLAHIEEITNALNKPQEWSTMVKNFTVLSQNAVESWQNVDKTLVSFSTVAEGTEQIVAHIQQGQGTIGKLIMTDDLYLRLTSLLSKGETTLDDVNHYGILFHLDKNWQRLRARRLNLLQKLRTPQEFRNFFNDEVNQISTSLSRVYMLLNKNGCTTKCPNLVKDYEFSKVFSELLRRVESVEEQLNMYNIQLQSYNIKETELTTGCN